MTTLTLSNGDYSAPGTLEYSGGAWYQRGSVLGAKKAPVVSQHPGHDPMSICCAVCLPSDWCLSEPFLRPNVGRRAINPVARHQDALRSNRTFADEFAAVVLNDLARADVVAVTGQQHPL